MLKEVKQNIYKRNGKGWQLVNTITDPARVYESLAACLRARYIFRSPWITRLEERPAYTEHGGRYTTVYQSNGVKYEFLTD